MTSPSTAPVRTQWRKFLAIGSIAVTLTIVVLNIIILPKLRESALNNVEGALVRRSLALAAQANLSLQSLSLVLARISEQVAREGLIDAGQFRQKMSGPEIHQILVEQIVGLPQIDSIGLIDVDGDLINASRLSAGRNINVSDRDFFQAIKNNPTLRMFLSAPFKNRGNGAPNIVIAQPLLGSNHEFIGILSGAVNLHYFEDHWRSVLDRSETESSISLNRADGTVLARFPHTDAIGKRFEGGVQDQLNGASALVLRKTSPIDGATRIESANVVEGYPLFLLATQSERSALQDWHHIAQASIAISGCCFVIVLVATFGLWRWLSEREHRLRAQADVLEAEKARLLAEAELRLSDESRIQAIRLDAAINNMSQGLVMCDAQERVVVVNDQYVQMYGLSPEIVKPGCTFRELLLHRAATGHLKNPDAYCAGILARVAAEKTFDMNIETADGRQIAIVNRPMVGGGWVATHQDVTQRNLAEKRLEETRRFLDTVVENAPVAIVVKHASSLRFALVNLAYEKLVGKSRDEVIGKTAYDIFPEHVADIITAGDNRAIESGSERVSGEMLIETSVGGHRATATTSLVVRDNDRKPQFLIVVIEDVTERRKSEARIAYMAHHDALTGLPNRVLLHQRLDEALLNVTRGEMLAVLYLDLDHFKSVNDTLGHSIGNDLLKVVAGRLRGSVKDVDTVARLGGDEFLIILRALESPADAANFAHRIREAVTAPIDLEGNQIFTDVSIGIALAPNDAAGSVQILQDADMALYGAKADGRGTFRFFEPEMGARINARRVLELDLRKALATGEFELQFQPLVNLEADKASGCEALLRWRHPEHGLIEPGKFIPVAEDTGLIASIGEWALRTACTEAASWPGEFKVAVNVSPIQFKNQSLAPAVISALAVSGLAPHRLEIEITEAVLMLDTEATLATLHRLRGLGVGISMDDFGTGYSSLNYLRSFPFDKIKIDRSFISGLDETDNSVAIVRAITELANSLNMATTAEGIETRAQLDWVRSLGCTEAQGYLFSYPKSATEIRSFFEMIETSENVSSAA